MPLSSKPEACPFSVESKNDCSKIFSNQREKTVDKTPFFDLYSGGVIHLAGRMACADFTATMNGREDVKCYYYIYREECVYRVRENRMLFDAVKRSVTTRQAAEHYQLQVDRKGLVACPFHNDRTPSMKVDARFHCFGCGADGDVIDFTARLHRLDAKAAAEKLAADFHVPYEDAGHKPKLKRPVRNEEQLYRKLEDRCFRVLSDYLLLLRQWETDYAPQPEDEIWHPRFVEALQKKTYIEYLLDVLLHESLPERAALICEYGREVMRIAQRLSEPAAGAAGSIDADGRSPTLPDDGGGTGPT